MEQVRKIDVHILSAFVHNGEGGNPAGVVLNADDLSNEQKSAIASKVGLSETAFVSASKTADFKLDFFTPTRQIAHCGHATIATFSYLSQSGFIKRNFSSKETIDGIRDILIQGDLAYMEQKAPTYISIDDRKQQLLQSLGLAAKDIPGNAALTIVNTGNSFALIPVADQSVLEKITPDFDLIHQLSEEFDLIGYYVFSTEANEPARDATTRMFAPRYGIMEESGTGMAAGPLACYLHDVLGIKKERFMIEQGLFMHPASPSLIIAELLVNNGAIVKVMAGGKGLLLKTITVEI